MKTKLCLLAMPLVFVACGNKGQNVAKTNWPLQTILLMDTA